MKQTLVVIMRKTQQRVVAAGGYNLAVCAVSTTLADHMRTATTCRRCQPLALASTLCCRSVEFRRGLQHISNFDQDLWPKFVENDSCDAPKLVSNKTLVWDFNFDNLVSLCLEQSEIDSSAHPGDHSASELHGLFSLLTSIQGLLI